MIAGGSGRSAVLLVNPASGRLAQTQREEVAAALAQTWDIDVVTTTDRDAGMKIAADLADRGTDVVFAFGGDGHVNEVANGLAGTETALAIIPGGTMNVFARALGLPLSPLEAVRFLGAPPGPRPRSVSLGRANDRYFTFSAGCGFDAEAAGRVESDLRSKRRFGQVFFFWSALQVLAATYRDRHAFMELEGPWGRVDVAMAIACNCGPYAYLGGRPIVLAPEVELEGDLDVFALRRMRILDLPGYAVRALKGDLARHPDVVYRTAVESFSIRSEQAFARHVDGEPLAPAKEVTFSIHHGVLQVLA